MKKINVLMVALAALALSACNAIEEAATVKIDVSDFSINIPASLGQSAIGITRADGMATFSGSYTLSINEPQFSDLKKYKNLMTGITVEDITITITQPGTTSGTATNIKLSATNVTDFTLNSYNFGQPYRGNANLLNFIRSTILQLKNDSVVVSISGETNVTGSSPLTVIIAVSGIQVLAKTIEF